MPALRTLLATLLLAGPLVAAAAPPPAAVETPVPRLALRSAQLERAAQGEGRFAIKARLAPAESAGELREGGDFVLIGRLQKAGAAACGSGTVFKNGFEGN
jgi:hypothetical protein